MNNKKLKEDWRPTDNSWLPTTPGSPRIEPTEVELIQLLICAYDNIDKKLKEAQAKYPSITLERIEKLRSLK